MLEYVPEPYASRFWTKVDKTGDCWIWIAGVGTNGYGKYGVFRIAYESHVVAYVLTYGPPTQGLMVLHRCNNKLCVRPEHLYAGDHSQNALDSVRAGTWSSGHKRIDKSDGELMVAMKEDGIPSREIAAAFNVSVASVNKFYRNR